MTVEQHPIGSILQSTNGRLYVIILSNLHARTFEYDVVCLTGEATGSVWRKVPLDMMYWRRI